jgi:hypothetical protein
MFKIEQPHSNMQKKTISFRSSSDFETKNNQNMLKIPIIDIKSN